MRRDDEEPTKPLPQGVAVRERDLMAKLYVGARTKLCPDCGGAGTQTTPPTWEGGRPQQKICPTCRGQRKVPA